ncbi:hypothetical protein COL516b_007624 [Colletotrichum fioriniae]|nr:uncharacterized protein COL516b_007624 [Colletotrichum fioriniae]KAJ0301650.1 hypothetical protein COL516b_007624 [Colletotrichum fioriniae]
MDPSSPAKRRALAPLDANVNAISSPTKLHKHSKLGAAPQSPRKSSSSSPIKSLNLKRSFAAAAVDIFDENALVPKKKQCQEPASAAVGSDAAATTTTTAAPVAVVAPATTPAREVALASEATSPVTAIPSASRAAQTEMEMDVDPDATETQSEQSEEQNQQSEQQQQQQQQQQQPEPEVQGENELLPEQQQDESRHETPRTRSASPDTSAVFDTSAMDTSQNTTILTEPDAEQQARTLPPPRPRRLLTREEARQKARILRLKLGLANYKLQTGQENVPLDKLEVKPRPGQQQQQPETKMQSQTTERALPTVMVQPPSSRDGPPEKDAEEVVEETETDEPEQTQGSDEAEVAATQAQEKEPRTVVGVLPRLETDALKAGGGDGNDEPTSAVSGGIVSSLLSLARGSSSSVSTSS